MALLFVVMLLFINAVAADFSAVQYCSGTSITLKGNSGVFGCLGYNPGYNYFSMNLNKSVLLTFRNFTLNPYTSVTFQSSYGTNVYTASSPPPPAIILGVGSVQVAFYSSSSSSSAGFVAIQTDNYHNVLNGNSVTVPGPSYGGFFYFVAPVLGNGTFCNITLSVSDYDGIEPPVMVIGLNSIPTLGFYNFVRTTTDTSTHPTVNFNTNNPPNGAIIVGAFLYGTSSSLTYSLNYTYTAITNNQKINSDTDTDQYFQFSIPYNTPVLTLRLSRQLPGGYVSLYVGEGFAPSSTHYNYKLDTTQHSYFEKIIYNPWNITSPVPGLYVLNFLSDFGDNAGFVFQASWGATTTIMTKDDFLLKNRRQATVV